METILSLIILIFSVILHEVAHGFMADKLGDPTARLEGRLTLNPIPHIDMIGSIIVPLITSLVGFTFGWAKPVPYNPYNIRDKRKGEFLIAAAGPGSNIFIAVLFGALIRILTSVGHMNQQVLTVFSYIVIINLVLAVFNLIPIPPLDGSKLVFSLFPDQYGKARMTLERYGPLLILVVVFFLWQIIAPVVPWIFKVLTGFGV